MKTLKDLHDFLKSCGTYYLATMENGEPRVRPFGTIDCYGGKLCFLTNRNKPVAQQILKSGKASICAFDGKNCWVRIDASASEETDVAAQKQMLDAYPNLRAAYTAGAPETLIVRLDSGTASVCSFTAAPETFTF